MSIDRHYKRMIKKKKRRRRFLFFLVIPSLIIAFSAAGYGAFLYKKAETVFSSSYKDDGRDKSDKREKAVDPDKDNVSILFIGVDGSNSRQYGEKTRSDALMLATLNKAKKSVKLVSIPRDSYVYIPEVEYKTKINHAHYFGGPKATIDTIEETMDIPVDYYVKMNFYAFMEVIDALDGIVVDVPYEISEKDAEDHHDAIHLFPGKQILDGEETLALARTRKQDNDIERGKRQQEILKAITKKAISANSLSKYDDIIEAIGSNMETNMTFDEMKSFISYGLNGKIKMDTLTLEGQDMYIDGTYYWELDEESVSEVTKELKNHLKLP
ncbi:LCP family protein [Rossellomorea aquimaris]|uniref:LCP family protein n=1 Tax=Rossellomorea aquimaris TaxID=189382 RepID=UPI001CD64D09|nr:LCP family protein [Rossellomorea aquimaris]MCA1055174.1 LCP family protein [Rossellomorea aquimaris]